MNNYNRKFGNQGYGAYGKANYLQASGTEMQFLTFKDFTGGYSAKDSREDTPPSFTPNSLDTYVTVDDRLTVVPGTTLNESLEGHDVTKVVLHTSLDFTSDLVLFDPPFIGIKHEGDTEWFDVGIPAGNRKYQATNFGGTLLFSNGNTGMYAREVGKHTVELVEGAPAARAYATFAGRVFAGYAIIDGNRQPLGVSWSGADSDYKSWELFDENGATTGAGFELLIDDMAAGDAIVALRPMGLDFMAVILRHSIWVARRTGDLTRPADFQPRVPGVGAITSECCKTTRFGVVFLADGPGVYLFDGNAAQFISDEITIDLKEMSRTELASCTAEYNPLNRCYYLFTPVGTFVYDFERKRWHKRSLMAYGATVFASQLPQVIWGEITGSWADHDEVWQDLNPEELDDLQFFFLGSREEITSLEIEDEGSLENFLIPMEPYWEFPLQEALYSTQLVTTKQILLNYDMPGTVELHLPNNAGDYELSRTAVLSASGLLTKVAFGEFTGKGAGLKILFTVGKARIRRVQLGIILRGPRIEPLPAVFSMMSSGIIYDEDFAQMLDGALPDAGWDGSQNGQLVPASVLNGALEFKLFGGNSKFRLFREIEGTLDLVYQITHSWPTGQQMSLDALIFKIGSGAFGWPGQIYWGLSRSSTTQSTYFENDDTSAFVSRSFNYGASIPQNIMYQFKMMLGDETRVLLPLGHLVTYTAPLAGLVPELIALNSRSVSGAGAQTFRIGRVSAMKSNRLTCNAPDGWKLQLDGVDGAPAVGGVVTWDDSSFIFPGTTIKLFNAEDVEVASLSPEGGVWGGSIFSYS